MPCSLVISQYLGVHTGALALGLSLARAALTSSCSSSECLYLIELGDDLSVLILVVEDSDNVERGR